MHGDYSQRVFPIITFRLSEWYGYDRNFGIHIQTAESSLFVLGVQFLRAHNVNGIKSSIYVSYSFFVSSIIVQFCAKV